MIALAVICALGLPAGFLLLMRVPLCRADVVAPSRTVSVVIPARNEEHTLPALLDSLNTAHPGPKEVIVVDDHSTDSTAQVAKAHGAIVISALALPAGWTGKTWACFQGAKAATAETLLFLDADTWFEADGFQRMIAAYSALGTESVALSLLPFHLTREPYEELSLFFNLLMAFGAGGFGVLGHGRLFGQSLLLSHELYTAGGGHESVRKHVLENVAMAQGIEAAGGRCLCREGRGVINMRMFPEGFTQLCEGWTKAFADGAASSDPRVLAVAVYWLSALCTAFVWLLLASGPWRLAAAVLYACSALQVAWFARQIGSFRWTSCALYPVPLIFFFALFTRSLLRRALKRQVTWRGRKI